MGRELGGMCRPGTPHQGEEDMKEEEETSAIPAAWSSTRAAIPVYPLISSGYLFSVAIPTRSSSAYPSREHSYCGGSCSLAVSFLIVF